MTRSSAAFALSLRERTTLPSKTTSSEPQTRPHTPFRSCNQERTKKRCSGVRGAAVCAVLRYARCCGMRGAAVCAVLRCARCSGVRGAAVCAVLRYARCSGMRGAAVCAVQRCARCCGMRGAAVCAVQRCARCSGVRGAHQIQASSMTSYASDAAHRQACQRWLRPAIAGDAQTRF